ncbi:YcaO-like family protein [Sporosarcina sp. NPDC096371]|uniref:YcaO-like family protein n=1 Tax=Sporosarcina sp. NPDC096371 TaxID=3364530 RepID=UPI0038236658
MIARYLDDINDYKTVKHGEVSVYAKNQFTFIGPIRKEDGFCLNCFRDRLEEIELSDYYLNGDSAFLPSALEKKIIEQYVDELQTKNDQDLLYLIDWQTNEIKLMATFKRGNCEVCSNDAQQIDSVEGRKEQKFDSLNPRQESWGNVKAKIDRRKQLVYNSRLSIVNRVNRSADSFGLPMVETEVHQNKVSLLSYGRTSTYEKSRYTSILESLERYATAFPYKLSPWHFKEAEHDRMDLTLSEIMELSDLDKGEYTPNTPVYYREVDALHSDDKVLIPEQLIYFDSHHISNEKRYIFDSSNGSALGSTVDEASLYALLELFERDAFLSTWYGKIPPTRINCDSIDSEKIQNYMIAMKKIGIKVHLFDISMELKIPTIWVLLEKINPGEADMAFYTAAATSFDLEDAIEKSLIEATTAISVFANVFQKQEYKVRKKELLEDPLKVSRLEDHLLLYSNKEASEYLSFALETAYEMDFREIQQDYVHFAGNTSDVLDYFHRIVCRNSTKAYRAVTENPNLEKIGFVNVKYIVPEMLTMTFGHQNRRIVYSRIEKAIRTKGRGQLDRNWTENVPHPFP